jgi:hypothetical protein
MIHWPIVLGPVVREHIMGRVCHRAKFSPHALEIKKEEEKGAHFPLPFQSHAHNLLQVLQAEDKLLMHGPFGEYSFSSKGESVLIFIITVPFSLSFSCIT